VTEKELKDFRRWFNHTSWQASDRVGEIGALMLNQMPKLIGMIDILNTAANDSEAKAQSSDGKLKQAVIHLETKDKIICALKDQQKTNHIIISVLAVACSVGWGLALF
jgi:hypothetical protein